MYHQEFRTVQAVTSVQGVMEIATMTTIARVASNAGREVETVRLKTIAKGL